MHTDRSNIQVRRFHRAPGKRQPSRIVPIFTGLSFAETKNRYIYTPHRHREYEVILVDRGTYRCTLNDTFLSLKPNEIVVVKPGDQHADDCEPALRYLAVTFQFDSEGPEDERPRLFGNQVTAQQQCLKLERREYAPILERLRKESEDPDAVAPLLQDALLLELFWRMVRALPGEAISDRFLSLSVEQGFPSQLMRMFRGNMRSAMSVDEMAERMHMSKRTLSQRCRRTLGTSPARAFLKCKMDEARYLLEQNALSVKETALYLGFADPYHFSKCFKKCFGMSPSEVAD